MPLNAQDRMAALDTDVAEAVFAGLKDRLGSAVYWANLTVRPTEDPLTVEVNIHGYVPNSYPRQYADRRFIVTVAEIAREI